MKILFIFTITIWIIVVLLIILFVKKYCVVNAICVNSNSCENLNKTPGFIYFEYKNDFDRGMNIYYGRAITTGGIKEGKQCRILIAKKYNESYCLRRYDKIDYCVIFTFYVVANIVYWGYRCF